MTRTLFGSIFLLTTVFTEGIEHHKVVTRFDDLEIFYLEMRKRDPLPKMMSKSKTQNLNELFCKTVFETRHFQTRLESHVELNSEKTISYLRKYQRSLIDKFYEQELLPMTKSRFCSLFPTVLPLRRHQHRYIKQSVLLGDIRVTDFMHLCLVREDRTQSIKPYFISRVYKLKRGNAQLKTAFLFTYNRNEDLVVDALIEPSKIDKVAPSNFKMLDLRGEFLRWNIPEQNIFEDPTRKETVYNESICWLPESEKLRLCASVMNTDVYRIKVHFWPVKFNVEYNCRMREVYMGKLKTWLTYKQWVIGCKTKNIDTRKSNVYYVSRSGGNDTNFFVFHRIYNDKKWKIVLFGETRFVTVLPTIPIIKQG